MNPEFSEVSKTIARFIQRHGCPIAELDKLGGESSFYSLYAAPGFVFKATGTHGVNAYTVRDAIDDLKGGFKPCNCAECQARQS